MTQGGNVVISNSLLLKSSSLLWKGCGAIEDSAVLSSARKGDTNPSHRQHLTPIVFHLQQAYLCGQPTQRQMKKLGPFQSLHPSSELCFPAQTADSDLAHRTISLCAWFSLNFLPGIQPYTLVLGLRLPESVNFQNHPHPPSSLAFISPLWHSSASLGLPPLLFTSLHPVHGFHHLP